MRRRSPTAIAEAGSSYNPTILGAPVVNLFPLFYCGISLLKLNIIAALILITVTTSLRPLGMVVLGVYAYSCDCNPIAVPRLYWNYICLGTST